jgi:hypothetical protein
VPPTWRPGRAARLDVLVPQLAAATDDNPATPVTDLSKAV